MSAEKPPQTRLPQNRDDGRARVPSSLWHPRPKDSVNQLVRLMLSSLETGQPVNLGLPPHHETTEALHRLVYMEGQAARLSVVYNDGTSGRGFPARVLYEPEGGWDWKPERGLDLRLGTLSFRHVDLDNFVDLYLLRDKETRRLSQGAVEVVAYKAMKRLLQSPQLAGPACITIYQAGLEPLAVGVYLALVEHLQLRNREGLGPMRVKPIYHVDEQPLSIWGAGIE